jgi:5-bromo-4-chloroindolyl phosphate hydrolysis protein
MALSDRAGLNWIVGGAAAAVVLPGLTIGLGMPFVLAAAAAVISFGGTVLALAPRRPFEGIDASGFSRNRIELASQLLSEADPMVRRLDAAGRALRNKDVGNKARHMAGVARSILEGIEKDPSKLERVRRFMTYYLPRAAEMSEAYGLLETQTQKNLPRMSQTAELIDRLDQAFTRYSDSLVDADLNALDIELKLLKNSLDDDLGPAAPKASTVPSTKRTA